MDVGAVNFVTQGAAKLVTRDPGRSVCPGADSSAGAPLSLRREDS